MRIKSQRERRTNVTSGLDIIRSPFVVGSHHIYDISKMGIGQNCLRHFVKLRQTTKDGCMCIISSLFS